jgi:amino acid transporter
LPASHILKKVHSTLRSPVAAIWTATVISILFTLYTPAYTTIVSVTVIFIFISYGLPVILGGFAYGRSWTHMGPWNMGPIYRLVAILTAIAIVLVIFLGVQPPNDAALNVTLAFLLLTAIVWFGFERRRFKGPPNVMKMD